jgi:Ion transport protein
MMFEVSPGPALLEPLSLIRFADDFFLFVTVMYVVDISVRLYGLGWRSFRANGWNLFDVFVATGTLLTTISVRLHANGYEIEQLQKLFLVSIALKLVQRMNSLNKLFKTAVYVAIWIHLFVFSHEASTAAPVCLSFSAYFRSGLFFSCSSVSFSWRLSA